MTAPAVTLLNLFQSDRWGEHQLPLGSLYIDAALAAAGCEVDFRDLQFVPVNSFWDPDALARHVGDTHGIVGISMMIDALPLGIALARRLHEADPTVQIVLGGPGPSSYAAQIVQRFPWIRAVVRKEGEETFPEIVAALTEGRSLRGIAGIDAFEDGVAIHEHERGLFRKLDDLPSPRLDRLPLGDYAYYTTIASRGCPYGCRFCSIQTRSERTVRSRSPAAVVDELLWVQANMGTDFVAFQDDIFLLNRKWVRRFIAERERRGLTMRWGAFARVDGVDEAWLDEVVAGGMSHVTYGIDAGSDSMLDGISKGFHMDRAIRALEHSVTRVLTTGYFIWGYPDETLEDFFGTYQAAHHAQYLGARAFVGHLIPLAGAPVTQDFTGELTWHDAYPFMRVVRPPAHSELLGLVRQHPDIFGAFYSFPTPSQDAKWGLAGGLGAA